MKRYEPECVDGTLFLVTETERVEIGAIQDVIDSVGGETYTLEYDENQRTQPWLEIEDGVLEIDVREMATTMSHSEAAVSKFRSHDMETDRYGLPTRTVEFANTLVEIIGRQGKS